MVKEFFELLHVLVCLARLVCSFLGGEIHVRFRLGVTVFSHGLTKSSSCVGVGGTNISTHKREEKTDFETKLLKVRHTSKSSSSTVSEHRGQVSFTLTYFTPFSNICDPHKNHLIT